MLAIGSKHKAKKASGAAEHVTMGGGTCFICCHTDGEKQHGEKPLTSSTRQHNARRKMLHRHDAQGHRNTPDLLMHVSPASNHGTSPFLDAWVFGTATMPRGTCLVSVPTHAPMTAKPWAAAPWQGVADKRSTVFSKTDRPFGPFSKHVS